MPTLGGFEAIDWVSSSTKISRNTVRFDHPLFVGFFARLVVEEWDELPDTLSKAQLDARFLGEYNFLHISFLMNVINRGIELAIEERHKRSGVDVNRIHDLFEAFAFVSLSENSKNIDQIVKCIKSMGEIKPQKRRSTF